MNGKPPPRRIVKSRLLAIRQKAEDLIKEVEGALAVIADVEAIRVQKWRCTRCGYVFWFTKPMPFESCQKCPTCGGEKFVPDGQQPLAD
jgi:rubrerythrin